MSYPALYNYETPQQTLDFWGKWHVQVGTLLLIVDVSTVKKNRYIDNCFLYQRECKSIYMTQLQKHNDVVAGGCRWWQYVTL